MPVPATRSLGIPGAVAALTDCDGAVGVGVLFALLRPQRPVHMPVSARAKSPPHPHVIGLVRAANTRPQFGHDVAARDTSLPQSLQVARLIGVVRGYYYSGRLS